MLTSHSHDIASFIGVISPTSFDGGGWGPDLYVGFPGVCYTLLSFQVVFFCPVPWPYGRNGSLVANYTWQNWGDFSKNKKGDGVFKQSLRCEKRLKVYQCHKRRIIATLARLFGHKMQAVSTQFSSSWLAWRHLPKIDFQEKDTAVPRRAERNPTRRWGCLGCLVSHGMLSHQDVGGLKDDPSPAACNQVIHIPSRWQRWRVEESLRFQNCGCFQTQETGTRDGWV